MVEGIPLNTPTVSLVHMIKITKDNPIFIPSKFVENLRLKDKEEEWAVMIFTSPCTSKIIRVISTKSPMVIKVFIEWSQTGPDTLHELGVVYMRNNIKTLYSTSICFCGHIPPHLYEGYIDSCDLPISEDQLKSELLALPNATKVRLTQYSL
ncbi:MAG: hypothetical protein ACFFC6_00610 [Promethearchaeota archaeon]